MYRLLFDVVFRRMDPERAHELSFGLIRGVARVPLLSGLGRPHLRPAPASGQVRVFGRRFPSRFGLAAGFDKDARGVAGLTMLGFGFVEVGTVTAHPQPGNEPPRLWRVLEQRALRNRMGFNNEGSAEVAARLRRLRATPAGRRLVVGVNIGKTKVTPAELAAVDYATSAGRLAPYADYLVVNVSSPNTPGLRDLQAVEAPAPDPRSHARRRRRGHRRARAGKPAVPLLVKIAPDLSDEDTSTPSAEARPPSLGLEGIVAVNTPPIAHVRPRSGRCVGSARAGPRARRGGAPAPASSGPDAVIIGVGGITTAADAREYVAVGRTPTLVQGYTGLIYEGPFWPSRITRALGADQALRSPAQRKAAV